MSVSSFNRRWATVILEALTRRGVRHVCIAPGSRSTPLTLAAAENRAFIHHTHFDERGLGHLALGLAKVSKEPVAVIVTSGTAVANLYPAIIEAGLTGEKLIVLTADRPPELIDCGANQAIRQPGIFASHPHRRCRYLARLRTFRHAGWCRRSITQWRHCAAVHCISTVRLPSRCTAKWTTQVLTGSTPSVTGGTTKNRGCANRRIWKVQNNATGSSGDKSAA
jgi:2-succinyl-5-enolpyruvyl-6-hydroxy-3-cyclohexene-1-carboxylate synthase